MIRIALVSCSGPKLDHVASAEDLYTSPLFKKSRAWAERFADRWAILSAQHGLVLPETVLEPYEAALPDFPRARYELWKRETGEAIARAFPEGGRLIWLAGALYVAAKSFIPGTVGADGKWQHEQPLRTLQIGERLRRLNNELLSGNSATSR